VNRRVLPWLLIAALASAIAWAQDLQRMPRFSGGADPPAARAAAPRRNVILMIGDGMGLAQRSAARLMAVGSEGRTEIDRLPGLCLVTTWSADAMTTDSAASATAFACGVKTVNGALGLDRNGKPRPTILEQAGAAGFATGIVTTAALSDATPAAFYAHADSRHDWWQMPEQLIRAAPDVALGGGWSTWLAAGTDLDGDGESDSRRHTLPGAGAGETAPIERARESGYSVVFDATGLRETEARSGKLLGLFAAHHLAYEKDRFPGGEAERSAADEPRLAEMTRVALERLANAGEQGFFLMVEGARIDMAGHEGDAKAQVWETVAFDEAVGVARRFAERDGRTLLIVTADHETGGLFLPGWRRSDGTIGFPRGREILAKRDERGMPVPGRRDPAPPALLLGCVREHTLGLPPDDPKAGLGEHTAIDVPLAHLGPGAERLHGVIDNTEVYYVMADYLLRR